MMMMKKEHKDAELNKKIEALRKKNEALMKRYQVETFQICQKKTLRLINKTFKFTSLKIPY